MIKRTFDLLSSLVVLIILSPLLILISLLIIIDSKGSAFYSQKRVGIKGNQFNLLKFRTMKQNSDSKGLLTIGKDSRITRLGHYLRKSKLDEIPQLINIIRGEMSVVGPRPEMPFIVKEMTPALFFGLPIIFIEFIFFNFSIA